MNILNNNSKIKRNNGVKGMVKVARRLTVCCLLLMAFTGRVMAQDDGQYVIKKDGHYLAHVNNGGTWVLQDATSFSPDCIWYSGTTHNTTGTNHNYYFFDGENYRFLSAPLQAEGTLSLSTSLPATALLRNTDQIYYFYDWDWDSYGAGVSRGHQHSGVAEGDCTHSWGDGQCWEVYWVEYTASGWKLSSTSSYNITTDGARFRGVTVTEHEKEVTNIASGELASLESFEMDHGENHALSVTANSYTYTYTPAYTAYVFEGATHNYSTSDLGASTPAPVTSSNNTASSYEWTITGDGAEYLSFASGSDVTTASVSNPTLYYRTQNTSGHKNATLTLTVTYSDESTQVRTATVTVNTPCQNPAQAAAPVVTYEGVTVSWVHTAESYKVYWKKSGDADWTSTTVGDVDSYTITGLDYEATYNYKVAAFCNEVEQSSPTEYSFTTSSEPGLLIYGSIYGGGRMANVTGKTEVVIINCDSIGAVYGGNDIAGAVQGADGSSITLGINENDPNTTYDTDYGYTTSNLNIGSVYGGGNGYYAYNGTSFEAASASTTTIAASASVKAMTQSHQLGDVVWTNGASSYNLTIPSIVKTAVTVTNDYVKVDSIFGGAKNAFLTTNNGNGSSITINGGTVYAVFGGNNWGGGQGYGKHYIEVNGTKTNLTANITNTPTTGYGRGFGIRYIFGGGNKVAGSTTDIRINGGQTDNVFAGGNSADVYRANVTVNCSIASGSGFTFGNTYSNAISSYSAGTVTVDEDYDWDGTGIYNVRTLFGGNNEAAMQRVPTVTLTSGSVGTVYGGGNAGDMLAQYTDAALTIDEVSLKYGTHVEMNSATMLVDYIYGGCNMSNVDYGTWVEIKNGHVGTVYGGCNVSGDVGSTRINPSAVGPKSSEYQAVQGATYVKANGGTIYKNLFAGSNGYYHCNNGINYIAGIDYGDTEQRYIGMAIPTHNETNVIVSTGATIKGNVYAGGNLACVGFTNNTVGNRPFPQFVGLASVRMDGGTVEGSVFGGGNMASIYGSNEVKVSGGTISGALYGGNDRTGQVGQITNRVMPSGYDVASDGSTSLTEPEVKTYVKITGNPTIETVYGGGNGDYIYTGEGRIQFCGDEPDYPIQTNTFVDININGGEDGGHIGTVYGGGNGVTVTGFITVFLNYASSTSIDNVDTIFGGNNKGDLEIVPDIVLLNGQVNTIYGGCNQGAMTATQYAKTIDGYTNIGSYVRLPNRNTTKVSGSVYGGCRRNGVTNNSLVLIDGGDHTGVGIFGGSDISGDVAGTSRVVVKGGTVSDVYGGGNGNYTYTGDLEGLTAPYCHNSRVDMLGGTAANLFAGGYAGLCGDTYLQMDAGTVSGSIFGGGNQAGTTTDNSGTGTSTVVLNNGTVQTAVYGGCNSDGDIAGAVVVSINDGTVGTALGANDGVFGGGYGASTTTSGDVTVNIGVIDAASAEDCPVLYGDIYGGSALGTVNDAAADITTVNFLNGTLHGNLYGGGLGNAQNAARVNGRVVVNVSNSTQAEENCFINLTEASVYGCNNTNGSPQDDVTVNIYKTAHTVGTNTVSDAGYAIANVFGGGKQANYLPENGAANSTKKATVHVYGCSNTIGRVFGGGDAAASTGVATIIEGGRFNQIFGGGNGEVTAANIGNGGASLTVSGGIISQLFGGSNSQGTISGPLAVSLSNSGSCTEDIKEFFAGGNAADITGNISTTIDCSNPPVKIDNVYGGSNLANITGDVSMTIQGGQFVNVFGGSKGTAETAANITGNVTLTLNGGDITNAFGACNVNGNITGSITVNVNDLAAANCGLELDYVFGGGKDAAYTPTNSSLVSPQVNISNGTVAHNVYGGGKGSTAVVTANPNVTIGDNTAEHLVVVGGDVYGGGDAAAVTGNTAVTYNDNNASSSVAHLFGGGNAAGVSGSSTVTLTNGKVTGGIYGGCNSSGSVGAVTVALNGGQVGATGDGNSADVYGGGYGASTTTSGDINVTLGSATVYGDIYGGSALGAVNTNTGNTTTLNINGSNLNGTIYGGGKGQTSPSSITAVSNGNVIVNFNTANTGLVGLYGGANINGNVKGYITMNVNANVGATGNGNSRNIFGGGLGAATGTEGNVTVNIGDEAGTKTPVVYGDIYGGSALGNVNNETTDITTVNFLNGTLHGNIYGGGLGDAQNAAKVNGKVLVYVSNSTQTEGNCKIDLRGATIYGCNNTNGSPQDDVEVHIYKTAYNYSDYLSGNNYTAANGTDPNYAIDQVFGGGNQADYAPENGLATSTKKAKVFIYGCDNTIRRVFGGGNAAAAVGVQTVINGGRFDYIFGGGNGEVTAANIGAGGTDLTIHGCKISHLFGGSNASGTISGDMRVNVDGEGECAANMYIAEFFCGNNLADIGTPENNTNIIATIGCGTIFGDVYGGCNLANVYGNVTLTINGGTINNVYGGSKGRAAAQGVEAQAANIYGSTTLNIHAGAIGNAFGGSNINGNITGPITVNMDWSQSACAQKSVGYVYGASNLATYTPTTPGSYPAVNIKHGTVTNSVFGGGKGATAVVTSNPVVTIGDNNADHYAIVTENVYGGGDAAAVTGNTTVTYNDNNASSAVANLFGGGNAAGVSGTANVNMTSGKVTTGIYGGCNSSGTVAGNIVVAMTGGQVGTDAYNTANIHGGGYGSSTATNGNVTVNINGASATVYGDVYGGSALGNVNDATSDNTNVTLTSGAIHGSIYGGGLGNVGNAAAVNGKVHVSVSGGTVDNVFGCNNVNGAPLSTVEVTVTGGTAGNVYGGGNVATYTGTPAVTIEGGTINNNVFGGGKGATAVITGNTLLNFKKGLVKNNVYGGGELAPVTGSTTVNISNTSGTTVVGDAAGGFVYGGGYGATATVSSTNVGVSAGEIKGGVFGGGELAAVYKTGGSASYTFNKLNDGGTLTTNTTSTYDTVGVSTNVNITGGSMAYVYGGGRGNFSNGAAVPNDCYTPGAVMGNTNVVIGSGATVAATANIGESEGAGNVYGGGMEGIVLGNTSVTINGGTYNYLYGGGRGFTGDGTKSGGSTPIDVTDLASRDAGFVYGNTNIDLKSGIINHDMYAGGEGRRLAIEISSTTYNDTIASVMGNTNLSIENGTVKGDVFGGGSFANVRTSAYNTLSGGNVFGSVYGGGKLGVVGLTDGNQGVGTVVNIEGCYIEGNVFAGCYGEANTIMVSGTRTLNLVSGTVVGNVYGGSYSSSDAYRIRPITEPLHADLDGADDNLCFVNFYGGRVLRNVYAGGYYGTIYGSCYVHVGLDAINDAPSAVRTANTQRKNLNASSLSTALRVGNSIYAGSDWGEITETTNSSIKGATGTTNIYVNGNGYDVGGSGTSNLPEMLISNSIYGCGTTTDGGIHRSIYLRNYGAVQSTTSADLSIEAPDMLSRQLYTIQRCDTLFIDNSNFGLIGKGDVSTFNASVKYAIYNVNEECIVANNSTVRISSPVEMIHCLRSSCTTTDTWSDLSSALHNLALTDLVTPNATLTADGTYDGTYFNKKNSILVEGGSYLAVRYKDGEGNTKHGPLLGYFFLRSSSNAIYAYAQPRVTQAMIDNLDDYSGYTLRNINDGGFISYKNENQFNGDGTPHYNGGYPNHHATGDIIAVIGNEYAFSNEPVPNDDASSGLNFRYWSYNETNMSYRDGVLVAQSNYKEYDVEDMLTSNCEVTLPTLSTQNAYFVVQTIEADEEILFEYGGVHDEANKYWMYATPQGGLADYTITSNVSESANDANVTTLKNNMKARPNRDFGIVMLSGESMAEGTKEIITPNGRITHQNFVVNEVTGLQTLRFILTYSNKVTNNVELGVVKIVLEEHGRGDATVTGHTVIRLKIITIGDIPASKELTNVAIMNPARGQNTDYNKARMVLPRLNLVDMSEFWITGIQLMAADSTVDTRPGVPQFVVDNEEDVDNAEFNYLPDTAFYSAPHISMSFGAAVNSDNTDGWLDKNGTYYIEDKLTSSGSIAWNTEATPDITGNYAASWNWDYQSGSSGPKQYEPAYNSETINDPLGWKFGSCYTPPTSWTVPESWLKIGTIDGRQLFSMDFTIAYKTNYNLPESWNGRSLGKVRFKMVYSRWEIEESLLVKKYYIMDVDVTVKAKTTVLMFYIDGVHGDNDNDGTAPYKAKKSVSEFTAEGSGYSTGDIIYVVNGITIDRLGTTRVDGVAYDHVELMRYPGGHMGGVVSIPTEEGDDKTKFLQYMANYTTDHPYTGVVFDVKSDLQMSNVTVNGVGEAVTLMSGTSSSTTVSAEAPLIVINEGAKVAMLNDVKVINNNNTANDAQASGIYVAEGARLEMASNARVSGNRTVYDADVDQAGGIYVGGSISMGESNYVYENVIKISDQQSIKSNVLLPAPEKYINISTITNEEGNAIDGNPSFTEDATIGVSKKLNRSFHLAEPERYNWYYDVDTTRIAYSVKNEALLSYNVTNHTLTDDNNVSGVVYNADEYSPYAVYFEESADYWKDVVTTKPAGYSVDLYTETVTISSAEGLAWLISEVYGYNGVTHPHPFDSITINLTSDVDMSAHRWTPLGSTDCKFKGAFDGGGNEISGIIASEPKTYVGLFGYVEDGEISNVTVKDSRLYGNGYVGGIAAAMVKIDNADAGVTNCSVSGNSQYANIAQGGTTGVALNVTISDGGSEVGEGGDGAGNDVGGNAGGGSKVGDSRRFAGAKSGDSKPIVFRGNSNYVGGVAGLAQNSKIVNNYIEFVNLASSTSTGMLVGSAQNCTIVNNGAVLVENDSAYSIVNMGGIAGELVGSEVSNNYAVGNIHGTQYAGGVAGELSDGNTVDNCFWVSGGEWGNMDLAPAGNTNNGSSVVSNSNDFRGAGVNCFVTQPINGETSLVNVLNNWITSNVDSSDYLKWIPDAHNDYSGYPVFGTNVRIRPVESERTVHACSQYLWHDTMLYESGTYHKTLRDNYNYVDSILTLKLSIHQPYYVEYNETVCEGSGFYNHGIELPSDSMAMVGDHVFEWNLKSVYGCDSTIRLNLNVTPMFVTEFYDDICVGNIYNDHGFHVTANEVGIFDYQRVETAVSGCDSIVRLSLSVNSLPELLLSGNLIVVEGDTAHLEVTGAAGYEWSTGDTTAAVAIVPQFTTDYFVRGYNEWGCETEIEFTIKVLHYDEIPEDEVPFDVYPNPTKGKIKVVTYGIERIEVLSPLGQILHVTEPSANECELDMRGYADGTYLLRVITPYGVRMRHVVKY